MEKIDNKTKNKIINLISAILPNVKIYLFGSYSKNNPNSWSDIDLALDNGEKISFLILDEIKSVLDATNIPKKFDIVDLNRVKGEFKDEISKEMIVWKS